MPRWPARVVVVSAAACAARLAWADPIGFGSGEQGLEQLGLGMVRVVLMLIMEPAIIAAEGAALALVLDLPWGRAIGTAVVANVASLLCGWVAAAFVTGQWEIVRFTVGVLIVLVVEVPIVQVMNRGLRDAPKLQRVAVSMNLATYTVARAIIWVVVAAVTVHPA